MGPVSTWLGDHLQAGKPSEYVTSHIGQLRVTFQPLKVIQSHWFSYQSKACTCNFLLVLHSNLGPVLQCFGNTAGFRAPELTPIPPYFLGCSIWTRLLTVGVNLSRNLKPFSHEIIFEAFQVRTYMWSRYLNIMDRQTDGWRLTVASPL